MLTTCIAPVPPPISIVVSYNFHKYTENIFILTFMRTIRMTRL